MELRADRRFYPVSRLALKRILNCAAATGYDSVSMATLNRRCARLQTRVTPVIISRAVNPVYFMVDFLVSRVLVSLPLIPVRSETGTVVLPGVLRKGSEFALTLKNDFTVDNVARDAVRSSTDIVCFGRFNYFLLIC